MPLSDTKLRSIAGKPYAGEPELSDRDGLSVRITNKGTISWQYRFRFKRKPARLTLGRYPDLKLKDARELIPEIRGIIAKGLDPRQAWKANNEDGGMVTIADCVEKFLSVRAPKLKKRTQDTYSSVLNLHFKPLYPNE
ncbi:Arm DNA-binding domain-containing protein [Endozoicomonas ascidiicola]|uniref:Arm DNA-binding domain-containing protein n=1 Tax=Endozoicomonas ascidiicola TaxID=1698521 RepID=UPI00082A2B28|nr:Arm DNA-binding domain-containing protein [Endozoicomonas ascidiicola]